MRTKQALLAGTATSTLRRSPKNAEKVVKKKVAQTGPVRRSLRSQLDKTATSNNIGSNVPQEEGGETTPVETPDGGSQYVSRGLSKGLAVEKKRKWQEKLDCYISENRRKIVGENAANLVTECGILVRNLAAPEAGNWSKVDKDVKEKIWEYILVSCLFSQ